MSLIKKKSFFLFSTILICIALAFQAIQPYNQDAIWLLYCSKSLLYGGKYYYNFIEVNPPLILLFYMPAILVASIFKVSTYLVLVIYLFAWAMISLFISYHFFKKIFSHSSILANYSLLIIFICFTIFPSDQFTERENIALELIFPYLLLTVSRLKNIPCQPSFAALCGLFSAIGFCTKPYFFAIFLFVELYYLIFKHNLLAWIKIETLTIIVCAVCYILSIFLFTPEYIFKILPLANKLYFSGYAQNYLLQMLSYQSTVIFFLSIVITCLYLYLSKFKDGFYLAVLLLASIGFFISYLIAGQPWFYHTLPFVSLNIIILSYILFKTMVHLITAKNLNAIKWLQIGCGAAAILALKCYLALLLFVGLHDYYSKNYQTMISLIPKASSLQERKSVFIFSTILYQPEFDYRNQLFPKTQFSNIWFPSGIEKLYLTGHQTEAVALKNLLINLLMHTLIQISPQYILIDKNGYTITLKNKVIHKNSFLAFLLSNNRFKEFFQHYHYVSENKAFIFYEHDQ